MSYQMSPPDPNAVWSNLAGLNFPELYDRVCAATDSEELTQRRIIQKVMKCVKVPNLTKRSGLKEAFRSFEQIAMKLNWVFDNAIGDPHGRRYIARAIVSIWLSMCPDHGLCRKLIEVSGVLQRLLRVIAHDAEGRPCALQLLSVLACYRLERSETGFFELIKPLIMLFRHRNDLDLIEDTVVTLAHALDRHFRLKITPTIPVSVRQPLFLTADIVIDLLRRPSPSRRLVAHAFPILIHHFQASPLEHIKHPDQAPLLNLAAILLRSENITLRSLCVVSFFDLYPLEDMLPITFPAARWTDRNRYLSAASLRIVEDYGVTRCESERRARAADAFVKAFNRLLRASIRDIHELGRSLVSIILDGRYYDIVAKKDLPDLKFRSFGLPHTSWQPYLLRAADALRAQGETDAAETLEIEYLLHAASKEKIIASCKTVVTRNPQHVYAHVQLCLNVDNTEEFARSSKRALELPGLSPSMRRSVLHRSIELHAGQAVGLLRAVSPSDRLSQRCAAEVLQRVRHSADVFLSESPPDCPENIEVLRLKIMATFVLCGPQLSDDFSELQPSLQTLKSTARLLKELGYKMQDDTIAAEFELLMHHSREGLQTWGGLLAELNQMEIRRRSNDLATGLDDVTAEHWAEDYENGKWPAHCEASQLEFLHTPVRCGCDGSYAISVLPTPGPGLYQCSHCGWRSALLKKCSRCQNAWYCNTKCQTQHWETHKQKCRRLR